MANCDKCGGVAGCHCGSPAAGPPAPASPPNQACNEIPSQLITCFSGQQLPAEFPDDLPVSVLVPGNPGDVLQTIGPDVKWAPLSAPGLTCDSIKTAIGSGACIPAGPLVSVIGFSPSGGLVQSPPPAPSGSVSVQDSASVDLTLTGSTVTAQVIRDANPENLIVETPDGLLVLPPTCSDIKAILGSPGCVPDGTISKSIGFSSSGAVVKGVVSTGGSGSAPLDCAGFQSLLSGCPPAATSVVPLSFIALNTAGVPEKFAPCPTIKALVNRSADNSTGGCLDDHPNLTARVLGYDEATKEGKWVLAKQRYIAECRGSITVNQSLSTALNTLNDINTFWASASSPTYERGLRGGASWFNPATGRFTIGRPGFYRVSFTGLMVRVSTVLNALANATGHVYAGITIVRAAGTIDGTPYPSLIGVLRTGESPYYANGKNQDFVFSGEYFGPLNSGDQLWIRVVCTNDPDTSVTISKLEAMDDGKASFVVSEEPSYVTTI